ncbi:type I secretion C-terminal target domain-containing protein [Aureimonas fodinaquatilis]|uniref:Type I secretion C-terminal target domain-containing protein n=2 Tax=Aureimonas fodinaquatilis TaxID=2565783 RepID=A0A5B0DZ57_9HYPH|nr:type I secretion C-terminal target domain-containing protein [Aureimonas fodinaquatilis]
MAVIAGSNAADIIDAGNFKVAVILNGYEGDDQLTGTIYDDIIDGQAGNDVLTGGAGSDIFILAANGTDTITDFSRVQHDQLDLRRYLTALHNYIDPDRLGDFLTLARVAGTDHAVIRVDTDGVNGTPEMIINLTSFYAAGNFSPAVTLEQLVYAGVILVGNYGEAVARYAPTIYDRWICREHDNLRSHFQRPSGDLIGHKGCAVLPHSQTRFLKNPSRFRNSAECECGFFG